MKSLLLTNTCKRRGFHHICYEVNCIDTEIARLCPKSCILIKKPKAAILFKGKRVAFLYDKTLNQVIEFLELERENI